MVGKPTPIPEIPAWQIASKACSYLCRYNLLLEIGRTMCLYRQDVSKYTFLLGR